MEKLIHSIKLNSLYLDQKIVGFFSRLVGLYNFTTEKIGLAQFEVKFITKPDDSCALIAVNLFKNKTDVLALKIDSATSFKTLKFEVSTDYKFNYIYFCILFKFFYQYIKQNTNYENLIIKTTRYQSYMFTKLFGFSVTEHQKNTYFLHFNTNESLQNIWEEFYGTNLEENLYNFLLPVDAGGYVPGNVKLQKSNDIIGLNDYQKTEKRVCENEQPFAEIKIGYNLYHIAIRDLSESGMAFETYTTEENPELPQIQVNHIYSLWVNNHQLKINWTNLSVQILWQKDQTFGCKILEKNTAWNQFIHSMQIKNHQRLTFKEKYLN